MPKWGKTDLKQLKALEQRLAQLEKAGFDKSLHETANKIAQILLNKSKKRTPVGVKPKLDGPKTINVKGTSGKTYKVLSKTGAIYDKYWSGYVGGTLRDAWEVKVTKESDHYLITLMNPTEYASYVEYGHRQTPGRYVPALGKTLKASWVKGKLMMTISVQEVEVLIPQMLQNVVYQVLKEVFDA